MTAPEHTSPTARWTGPDPDRIGPYRIVGRLGEGGMGVVYEAEQTEPVRRHVALKLVKLGMDTREVVARFTSERQALALMNHPYIAQAFDAGTTDDGRPFFVMELVAGEPLDIYCDRTRLTTEQRLQLFLKVCDAVQHAHQKGVIHRDLKPSNILVTDLAGGPRPKIIDFGVAKAIGGRLSDLSVQTALGHFVGTPAYMSPEQLTGLDVDTRSDVYALGVLLYELLVGVRPFEAKAETAPAEVMRRVLQAEPTRPSARLATLGAATEETARRRRMEVRALRRSLAGDLDWIVLKALEKDRTRRYPFVSELIADVERHLRHEPVLAGTAGRAYRVGKFVRRHTLGVAVAATLTVALAVGAVGTTIGLVRALRAEATAKSEAETATQVSKFLVELFEVSDPNASRGNTITAREILDKGAERIEHELAGQPLVQARLLETMGKVYFSLGLFGESRRLLEQSLGLRERLQGPDHPDVGRALVQLGRVEVADGRLDEAHERLEHSEAILERSLGPESLEFAEALYWQGNLASLRGIAASANSWTTRALSIFERNLGHDSVYVGWCYNDLGISLANEARFDAAAQQFQKALDIKGRHLAPDHPDLATACNNLGYSLLRLGRYDEAHPLAERGVAIAERSLGPDHFMTGLHLHTLGELYRVTRDPRARPVLERAAAIQRNAIAGDNPELAQNYLSLARLDRDEGNIAEARENYRRALEIQESALGTAHAITLQTRQELEALDR